MCVGSTLFTGLFLLYNMKIQLAIRIKRLIFLVRLLCLTGGVLVSFGTLHLEAAIHADLPNVSVPQASHRDGGLATDRVSQARASGLSCANPTPDQVEACEQLEQQILASTVRIEWNLWVKNDNGGKYSREDRIAHATVKEGRYLVTHNHGEVLQSDAKNKQFNRVSIFTSDGILVWPKGPIHTLAITVEDEETLMLDFGEYGGQGLFAMWGISSAEFRAWDSLSLQPGMEVAQVVWNGSRAHIDWVTIDDVETERGTPRLELASFVPSGTSGGGVFWKGYHVANTWYNGTVYADTNGAVSRQFSVAALNSLQVAAQLK